MTEQAAVEQLNAESAAVEQAAEATEQAAPSAGAEVETKPDQSAEGSEKPPEKKGGFQRRIDELTRKARLAEAEAEFWRQKAIGSAPADKSAPASDAKASKKPNAADFETTEEYLDARDEWVKQETLKVAREENQKAEQQREQKTEQEILAEEWNEKEAPIKEKLADYKDVADAAYEAVENTLRSAINSGDKTARAAMGAIAHTLPLLDRGPEVTYYLGQHPEEIEALSKLHPTRVVARLGQIEARLEAETPSGEQQPPPKPAPRPPTPVKKAGAPAIVPKPDDPKSDALSDEDWYRERDRQVAGRTRR